MLFGVFKQWVQGARGYFCDPSPVIQASDRWVRLQSHPLTSEIDLRCSPCADVSSRTGDEWNWMATAPVRAHFPRVSGSSKSGPWQKQTQAVLSWECQVLWKTCGNMYDLGEKCGPQWGDPTCPTAGTFLRAVRACWAQNLGVGQLLPSRPHPLMTRPWGPWPAGQSLWLSSGVWGDVLGQGTQRAEWGPKGRR